MFVKVAYEDAYVDPAGIPQPGRVRILPINSAHCLPVDTTEVLTKRGWVTADELTLQDKVLSMDVETDTQVWADVTAVNIFAWNGPLHRFKSERLDILSTPNHKWVFDTKRGKRVTRTSEEISRTTASGALVLSVDDQAHFPTAATYSDAFVELVGWTVTEGGLEKCSAGFTVTQNPTIHPDFCERINLIAKGYEAEGHSIYRYQQKNNDCSVWRFPAAVGHTVRAVLHKNKGMNAEFLTSLTHEQASILFNTILDGDGDTQRNRGEYLWQNNWEVMDSFQMLATMLGKRSSAGMIRQPTSYNKDKIVNCGTVSMYNNRHLWQKDMQQTQEHFEGRVWCPTTSTGSWVARTTTPQGKKQVFLTRNSYPEFHPHDRSRMLRFKLKYRFWGCVDTKTQALTHGGWKNHDQLNVGDEILSLDPVTDAISWKPVTKVNLYDYDGHLVHWTGRIDALTTPNHRWLVERQRGRCETTRYEREIARTSIGMEGDSSVRDLRQGSRIIVGGGTPLAFRDQAKWSDELVETVAWYVTEGTEHYNQTGCHSIYLSQKGEKGLADIRRIAEYWRREGGTFSEYKPKKDGVIEFYLGKGVKEALFEIAPKKAITPEFITSLTHSQAELFYNRLLDADGCRTNGKKNTVRWTQIDGPRKDSFQMLCALLGKRSNLTSCGEKVQEYKNRYILSQYVTASAKKAYADDGKVWCPTVEGGIWFARRNGSTYWTGNTSLEGTRQVMTYTEVISDEQIEEYINDELIDSRPNPMGVIPVVHVANIRVSGSPWGLPDCFDIITLNKSYNEISTDIADIINYHAAPITIIVGAKSQNLEKGAKKVWSLPNKDSNVFNLESTGDLGGAMEFLAQLKIAMHEMVGVPETALGQMQPISNTSGVALSIQFQPLMNRYNQKIIQYKEGLERINSLVLRQLFIKEPELLTWDENTDTPLKNGQYDTLDMMDPISYQTYAHFPKPLPLDTLIALNELQTKLTMGLESKEGSLRLLGEEFPEAKLAEIRSELIEDAKADGLLRLVQAQVQQAIMNITGLMVGPDGTVTPMMDPGMAGEPSMSGTSSVTDPNSIVSMQETVGLEEQMVTAAYGTKLPQRQVPNDIAEKTSV